MRKGDRHYRAAVAALAALTLVIGCSPARPDPASGSARSRAEAPAGPSGTLKIMWSIEPENLHSKLGAAGPISNYHWLFNGVLTYYDFKGKVHSMLAKAIPSRERGDWVVNPDGTMVTTYRLQESARWHDGKPVTAHDYVFAYQVYVDPEVPVRERVPESLMASVAATDDFTLVVNWKEPFVGANVLGYQQLDALPRHLLEEKYRSNKAMLLFGDDTDRQALADTLTHGLGVPADAFINPADAFFAAVDAEITKYPYDPARASALLAEAGWQRAQPGGMASNAAGAALDVEIWNSLEGGTERESAIIADNWKAVGINASIYMIPAARDRDHEHRASFPAVATNGRGLPLENFAFTSSNLPSPALRWQCPNRGSFHDPDVDRFHNLGMTSLDPAERQSAVVALHRRMSEIVGIGLLYYNPGILIAKSKLEGPVGETAQSGGLSWNIFQWRWKA